MHGSDIHHAREANQWSSVAYGNGTFVATATGGTNRVMYSTDGINLDRSEVQIGVLGEILHTVMASS